SGELLTERGYVFKLPVSVLASTRAELLVVHSQRKFHALQEATDRSSADLDLELLELLRDLLGCPSGPFQPGDGVASSVELHDLLDRLDHFRRFFSRSLRPAPSLRTRSTSTSREPSCCLPRATLPASFGPVPAVFFLSVHRSSRDRGQKLSPEQGDLFGQVRGGSP